MFHQVDFANVDLGAAHNGRIARRRVFADAAGRRFIVIKGKRTYLILIAQTRAGHGVGYVIAPRGK